VIPRYTRKEMGQVWSDTNRYQKWLDVELAAADTLAEAGLVPKDASATLHSRAKVDADRINEIETRVKHDVIAFTMAVGESIGDPNVARWLHYGLTSNDVVDTAQALLVRDASHIIERELIIFGEVLDLRAHEFRHTPQIGRTHGIHAEPITFGLKIANWFAENQRNIAVSATPPARWNLENFRRRRQRFASRSRNRRENLPEAWPPGDSRRHPGHPTRSSRTVPQCPCADRRFTRKDCPGNSPPAAHRSARSRGTLWQRAAWQFRHAP